MLRHWPTLQSTSCRGRQRGGLGRIDKRYKATRSCILWKCGRNASRFDDTRWSGRSFTSGGWRRYQRCNPGWQKDRFIHIWTKSRTSTSTSCSFEQWRHERARGTARMRPSIAQLKTGRVIAATANPLVASCSWMPSSSLQTCKSCSPAFFAARSFSPSFSPLARSALALLCSLLALSVLTRQ